MTSLTSLPSSESSTAAEGPHRLSNLAQGCGFNPLSIRHDDNGIDVLSEPLLVKEPDEPQTTSTAVVDVDARQFRNSSDLLGLRRITAPNRQLNPCSWFQHIIWRYCVELSLSIQVFVLVFTEISYPKAFSGDTNAPSITTAGPIPILLVEGLQCGVTCISIIYMVKRMSFELPTTKRLWQTYIGIVVAFSGLYFTSALLLPHSFHIHQLRTSGRGSSVEAMVACTYFSVATMTSTGFGDIFARSGLGQALTAGQMGIGMVYSIGIFAVAYSHFQELDADQIRPSLPRTRIQRFFKWIRTSFPLVEMARRFAVRCLLLVVIFCTAINLVVLRVLGRQSPVAIVILTANEMATLSMVIGMSVRLVRKMSINHLHMDFLVQSYVSTTVLFGGAYMQIYLAEPVYAFHFQDLEGWNPDPNNISGLASILWRFTFFSWATMTTTGFGNIWPVLKLTRCMVLVQMLVSVFYHVAIVGLGLNRLSKRFSWANAQDTLLR